MSDRLNILFLPSWYPSEQLPVNGTFVREHAKAVSLRHNVAVLYLATQAGAYRDYDDDGIRTIKHGVRFRSRGIGVARYPWYGLRDFARLQRSFKPDIIHVHVTHPAGSLGVAISLRYHIPMVLTEHSNPFSMQMSNPVKRFVAHRVARRARVICPVSNYLQRQMEEYRIKGPFVVIPNAVNTSLFSYQPGGEPATDRPKRMLLVALFAEYKGIPYLLQALAQLRNQRRDFTLDIAGDGPKRAEYESLTAELQLHDQVRFLGMKTKAEVAMLIHNCDFLVVSSLNETMGVTIVEALASGKPVVSTRCGGPEEVLTAQVGLLVEKASAEALRGGIAWMLDHFQNYDPQAIAAYANSRYSYAAVADQYDAVYRRAIQNSQRS